ncbi:MAG: TonB-dependent receptor [Gammaproteobacteria bacterium]|nr:TonB-dependent receptor [Gammaproteobacteria bacterium]
MTRFPITLALALTLAGPALLAQEGEAAEEALEIEEIVVTATFRGDELYQVPSSIGVVPAEAIARRGATHLEEILNMIPNLNYAKGASRARFLQIRGIGERGQFSEPLNSSVGLVVDGVDLSGIGTVAMLFDVEQVEVLRGPQGTRYGANALAGLVNVVSRSPTDTNEGEVELFAGNYGSLGAGAVISGPLAEDARGRLAARVDRANGFIENDHLGVDDTDNTDEKLLRGKLSWDAGGSSTVDISAGYIDANNGYDAFSLDNIRTTLADEPGYDTQETLYGSAGIKWHDNPAFTVEAHVGAASSDMAYGYDADWVYVGFHPWGYSGTDSYLRERNTLTAEVRLVSKDGGELLRGATAWTVGAYTLRQDVALTRQSTFIDSDFTSDYGMDRFALFGQTETALDACSTLTVGLRLERHSATYDDSANVSSAPEDSLVGGRVSYDRELAPGVVGYGSVSRGYKAGGFNIDGTLRADLREYDPEVLWNFEAGLKARAVDGRLSFRGSVFRMQRDDVQIDSSIVIFHDDGSTEFIDFVGNAAQGTNSGAELDVEFTPSDAVSLYARVGLLRSEYEDYINGEGMDLDGREQAHAPGYQFSVGANFAFGQGYFAQVGVDGRDEFYFSDSHSEKSDPYRLLNASIGYRGSDWSVTAWARNLADEDYLVRGFFFGNDPRDGYTDRGFTQLGEPRRFGITASRSW